MDNRELLELAAKAAAYAVARAADDGDGLMLVGMQDPWNPLEDNGDALRLAVQLRLSVKHGIEIGDDVLSAYAYYGDVGECHFEPHGDAPVAATRRAIVHAAAEIGKAMP